MAEPVAPIATNNLTRHVALTKNPYYLAFAETWGKLGDVREGIGGFMDGTYIQAHPREWMDHTAENPSKPTKKLKERRRIARYENFAAAIIDQLLAALFRESPTRTVGEGGEDQEPSDLEAWWEDVDGQGHSIDDYMAKVWDQAATFGHMVLYMDRRPGTGDTAAEAGRLYLTQFQPLAVADWEEDEYGELLWVKLLEKPEPRTTPADTTAAKLQKNRILVVDREKWTRYAAGGQFLETGEHMMGCVPCVWLYAKRRPLIDRIGQSVLYDPQLYIDFYNLTSELRELFRKQAFSILNIPLGTGPDAMDVERAKALLSQEVSTEGVVFSGAAAQYLSAEAANMLAYIEERDKLLRMIYRLVGVFYESDSKDAEAEGSLKLKREEMNQRLSGFADEAEQCEVQIAKLWYRGTYGDSWESRWDADEVSIQYPQAFEDTPFDALLEQAQAAMSLGYPPEILKALRKRLLVKFMPDLGPKEKQAMEAAIDSSVDDVTPMEQSRAELKAMAMKGQVAA